MLLSRVGGHDTQHDQRGFRRVKTIEYLTDPGLRELYLPGIAAAAALVLLCSVLSVIVVLKRLAFIGQGISHAAFGGIGLAAALGVAATAGQAAPFHGVAQFLVVLGFCLGAGLLVGALADKGAARADTVIGVVLVASMAFGAILIKIKLAGLAWESFLFGTLFNVGPGDALTAWVLTVVCLGVLWWARRPMMFWAFDEPASRAFGVSASGVRLLLMLLLSVATVLSMKLAGVVLATALLVIPGATALKLSERFGRVMWLSVGAAFVSIVGGLVLSFEADWPPGPSIVSVLTVIYAASHVVWSLGHRGA